MAHPEGEAASAPAPTSASDKAADFENFLYGDEAEEDEGSEPEAEDEGELEPEDLDEGDEEQADEEGEPGEPAIDAPVSLNAEEKKVFAQLPPEAQRAWAESENRRNAQVQEATTKASNAQREAEARAAAADAEAKRVYAAQLEQIGKAFEPNPPDPMLAQHDPARYIAEKAQYDALKAQHDDYMQQVRALGNEAETQADAAFVQNRDRELMTHPKIANPETREAFLAGVFGLAESVGFDPSHIARNATGAEVLAIAAIYERLSAAEEKAAKYDRAISKQMQKVRAAKQRNLRPNAAPQAQSRNAQAGKAWERVKATKSREEKASAFADYLEASGLV